MKILLVNKYYYVRGGSETYFFALAESLKKAGHEVIFFAMQDEKNLPCEQSKYFVKNIDFNKKNNIFTKIKLAFKMVYSREAKKKFEKLVKDEKPDIIHVNLFHRVLTASIIDVAKKHKIPVVFTMHDLNCVCPNHTMLNHGKNCELCLKGDYYNCVKQVCFKNSRAKCFMAYLESRYNKKSGLYNKIDCFITPSSFYQHKLEESKLTSSKIITMRNFLSDDYKCDVNQPIIVGDSFLYFGRLSEEKGVATLLKAVALNKSIKLKVVGTGPLEEELKKLSTDLNIDSRVEFCGFKKGEELKNYIRNSRAVILPSEGYENGPYSIMEAMALGKPAIVSKIGGLPEIVEDGYNGYIFKAFDKEDLISKIVKMQTASDNEIEKMGRNAIAFAKENFNKDKYIQQLVGIYNELLKRE